jgi:hypothetical protein
MTLMAGSEPTNQSKQGYDGPNKTPDIKILREHARGEHKVPRLDCRACRKFHRTAR